jgi:hypothetical protein
MLLRLEGKEVARRYVVHTRQGYPHYSKVVDNSRVIVFF